MTDCRRRFSFWLANTVFKELDILNKQFCLPGRDFAEGGTLDLNQAQSGVMCA
jgi:hypothetical protein